MEYAKNTSVTIDKSKVEIERTLIRYGAKKFMYGWDNEMAIVSFQMQDRLIKFQLKMPLKIEFSKTDTGRSRKKNSIHQNWEKSCRQRWRALALVIKAKLEAVETGISEFEEEFMAHIVLPNGSTVGEFMKPQIGMAYANREMPKLLSF